LADSLRGEWRVNVDYRRGDVATYRGSTYIAVRDNRANRPTTGKAWLVLAAKGRQGEPGIAQRGRRGPAGAGGGNVTVEATTGLAVGTVIGMGSGVQAAAQADSVVNSQVLGIQTTVDGNLVVQTEGLIEVSGWTWTPGARLYLSPTVAGGLTETAPTTTTQVVVNVALATAAASADIEISPGVLL
jgi:hypothetical protein